MLRRLRIWCSRRAMLLLTPGELPALWRGKLTGGYNAGNYDWVTYPDEGEAYRDRGFVYTEGTSIWGFGTLMHVDASAQSHRLAGRT